jgi:hypothetical protein
MAAEMRPLVFGAAAPGCYVGFALTATLQELSPLVCICILVQLNHWKCVFSAEENLVTFMLLQKTLKG